MTAPSDLPGHTRVSTQALASAARVIAADLFAVPAARIHVDLDDDYGNLSIALSLPLPLAPPATTPAASVWDRAVTVRDDVRLQFVRLTGSQVSRVDVRVTGVVLEHSGDGRPAGRRVA
ncbi:hypothetical protein [Zhihengliuella salsuginis]|uniref:Asp23 family, cell envelope-related function n=1 Tax=Zhihengliuella salsuginis TaxID=578222 RepID=A0ABQ3G9N2_9MICC|nr:hypothetical protein [Zhihengliuella salsuginis]GHC99018.1 hypothetical protein GCM10008096_00690 [Zhihengliuella salsuginis]